MSCNMRAPDGVTKSEMLQALWACTRPKPFCLMLGPKGEILGYADEFFTNIQGEIHNKLSASEQIRTLGCRRLHVDLTNYPDVRFMDRQRVSDAFQRCVRDRLHRS